MRPTLIGITTAGLFVAGFASLILVFADPPPGGEERQFAMAFAIPAAAGFLFGLAIGHRVVALLAVVAGGGPLLLGIAAIVSALIASETLVLTELDLLLGPAALAVVAGQLGAVIGRRIAPSHRHD